MSVASFAHRRRRLVVAGLLSALLGACSSTSGQMPSQGAIADPYEVQNRKIFAANQKLKGPRTRRDKAPGPLQTVLHNVSTNLSMPQVAVNSLLQGDLRGTGLALHRFSVNSVLGMGGMVDAASEFGVPTHDTDFGETLHVWGVGEGAYLVLPIVGSTTQRDLAGRVVDVFTDPLSYRLPEKERTVITGIGLADQVVNRSSQPDTYEAARDAHVQRRRAEVSSRRN